MQQRPPPPPYDRQAEEWAVASALVLGAEQSPDRLADLLQAVAPDDFYFEEHRNIWQAVVAVARRDGRTAVNQVTVAREMMQLGTFQAETRTRFGGASSLVYMSQLITDLPTPLLGQHMGKLIREISRNRQAAQQAQRRADDIAAGRLPSRSGIGIPRVQV